MEKQQERLVDEFNELIARSGELEDFMSTEAFANLDEHKRTIMALQQQIMCLYGSILYCRCKAEGFDVQFIEA